MTNLSDKCLKCADAFDLSVQTCTLLLETHKGVVSQMVMRSLWQRVRAQYFYWQIDNLSR